MKFAGATFSPAFARAARVPWCHGLGTLRAGNLTGE